MENKEYLEKQIVTYIGNKRKLLKHIEDEIKRISKDLGKSHMVTLDLFSGSGIVARLLKQYSSKVYANDLEYYSKIINDCYLMNRSSLNFKVLKKEIDYINSSEIKLKQGFVSKLYSPVNDKSIKDNERVFFTKRNANFIDTTRCYIDTVAQPYRNVLLALLLQQVSVHNNTSGVFKGFYKDSNTGKGKFGGNGENALKRIMSDMKIELPVLSNFESEHKVFQEDANVLVKRLKNIDLTYIDPPYNQHPYGSNYFMLNLVAKYKEPLDISKVSGIPKNWNRSDYNKKTKILNAFNDLILNLQTKYAIISYSSEGFLTKSQILEILERYGDVEIKEIKYNVFRGSRNLENRDIHLNEYLFIFRRTIK